MGLDRIEAETSSRASRSMPLTMQAWRAGDGVKPAAASRAAGRRAELRPMAWRCRRFPRFSVGSGPSPTRVVYGLHHADYPVHPMRRIPRAGAATAAVVLKKSQTDQVRDQCPGRVPCAPSNRMSSPRRSGFVEQNNRY